MRKIKLKVLITFFDVEVDRKRFKNEEFECSEKRAKVILAHSTKLVEVMQIIKK